MRLVNNDFVRFLLVGVINTITGLSLIYVFLNIFKLNYWISSFSGNSIACLVSYLLNKNITFKFKSKRSIRTLFRFFQVTVVCYGISYWASFFITSKLIYIINTKTNNSLWQNNAVLLGTGFYALSNYIGHKYYTFRNNQQLKRN